MVFNLWRRFDKDGVDAPFAVCDSRTVSDKELIPTDLYNYLEDQEHQLAIIISDFNNNSYETGLFVTVDNNPIPEDDNIYPFASILNPVSGQTVSDTVYVVGFATDNYQINQVQFLLDNEIVATLTDTPYTFFWDTLELADSSEHVLNLSLIHI